MTPAARYAAAIDVLDRFADGMAVEQALTGWARGARYAGSKDRAAVRDNVYDVLRCRGNCAALGGGTDAKSLTVGLLRLQGIDPATIFTGEGHAPPTLDPTQAVAPRVEPDPVRDVPAWMVPLLQQRFSADLAAALSTMQHRAPVYLRVNLRKATPAAALVALQQDGITAEADAALHSALRVTEGAQRVGQSAAYREGLVELQDLSAQRALDAVQWPDTGQVLDYCAGGGGKSLGIGMYCDARLCAHDAAPRRMRDLPERARRAGLRVELLASDAVAAQAPFDAVLCDVPCSGSGTWRRDPEAKWRLTPELLNEVEQVQARILADTARLVPVGGQLVYMTCSLFECENEAQIDRFLGHMPGWTCTQMKADTPLTASDGFFTAVLSRTA